LLTLLFTKIARSTPARITSRPRTTGAPGNWLSVKIAAADASTSDTNSDRSRPLFLMPQLRLAQRKPVGNTGSSSNICAI
jgi:hypothetical protein